MILVTLGTQDWPFPRLLAAIQKQIDMGNITEEVIVQAGSTIFDSSIMKMHNCLDAKEFDKLITECDILITHGGVGTIIQGLQKEKKIIAAARLKEFKEAANNHQLQLIENFEKAECLLNLSDFDRLGELLKKIRYFKPKKFKSNTKNMIEIISDFIENH